MTTWYILLSFVQVHVLLYNGKAEEMNLIQSIRSEVSTSMSSTGVYHTSATSWDSNNSIDNKATGDPNTCGCCAGTNGTEPPWLQIDLGSVYTIRKIQITGRPNNSNREQFQKIYIYVSNTTMISSNGSLVYHGNSTTNIMFKLLQQPPISFRYLMIRRFYASYLTICEVELFEASVNILDYISDKVLTYQSSLYLNDNTSYGPYNAIDGKPNYSIDSCQCCSVTEGTSSSWWQIDLRHPYLVNRLEIFGRSDIGKNNVQLQGAKIFAGNLSFDNAVNPWKCIYVVPTITTTTTTHFDYQLDEPVTAQIFNISLKSPILTLCEFIVYGRVPKCDVGHFGKPCSQKCHCADKNTCNVWTGKCKAPGCLPGWTGQACNKVCPFRRFGINCSTECHCSNNTACNSINGICATGLCDPGWKGQSCSQVCDSGTYGNQCSSSCGHCLNGTTCNNVNGTCFGGCIDGYFYNATDTLCNTQCDGIHFGKGCSRTCHCKSGTPCKNGNGECPNGECAAGWTSQACDTMCTNGSYGFECKNVCGKCAHGCNNVNGTCSGGCLDGYMLTDVLCKTTCQSGFYGHNCSKPCGHCNKDFACNISSGFCFDGCSAGFNGHLCETSCRNSTFGPNCANPCHCSGNSQCDIFQGNCSNNCDIGWAGFNCSIDLNILRRNTTSATALQSKMYSTCSADRAIDGIDAPVDPSNDVDLCAACSVAQNKNNVNVSWWQLDLGSMFLVKFIRIVGRPNLFAQSQSITGYINNFSMELNQTGTKLPINSSTGHVFQKELMKPRLFQYFKIKKQDTVLTLCEVKLYEAECPVGTFGDRCSNPCKCADKLNCGKVKGTCISKGCLPGWEEASCNKSCGHQHFGPDCEYQCHCFSNGSCAKDSGICNNSRCDPGWELSNCSKPCSFPHFGDICRETCHCLNNTECDHRDGKCDIKSCESGWQGKSCNVCDHRRFGINCSSVCNCHDNTSCNAITGHCNTGVCAPGWLGLSCDKGGNLIERIKYQVKTHMSSEAKNTNSTFAIDGQLGPDPDKCQCCSITYNSILSWWLLDLGKRYPLESIIIYGRNKEDSYQQLTGFKLLLLNNTVDDKPDIFLSNDFRHTFGENSYEHTLNNALARYIKIERPGVLTLCEVIVIEGNCRDGTFGEECVQDCHCADNKPCQIIHGYCQSPICKLGWMGKSCNESCTKNTFGEECKQVCYCEEGTCTSDYGVCPGKCRYGYRGVHCNIEGIEESKTADHSSAAVIGGSVAGGVVVIGILLLLVVLIYKRRLQRVKRNKSENYYKTVHRNMAQVDDETTYDTIDISHDNQDRQNEEDNVRVTGL